MANKNKLFQQTYPKFVLPLKSHPFNHKIILIQKIVDIHCGYFIKPLKIEEWSNGKVRTENFFSESFTQKERKKSLL